MKLLLITEDTVYGAACSKKAACSENDQLDNKFEISVKQARRERIFGIKHGTN